MANETLPLFSTTESPTLVFIPCFSKEGERVRVRMGELSFRVCTCRSGRIHLARFASWIYGTQLEGRPFTRPARADGRPAAAATFSGSCCKREDPSPSVLPPSLHPEPFSPFCVFILQGIYFCFCCRSCRFHGRSMGGSGTSLRLLTSCVVPGKATRTFMHGCQLRLVEEERSGGGH